MIKLSISAENETFLDFIGNKYQGDSWNSGHSAYFLSITDIKYHHQLILIG